MKSEEIGGWAFIIGIVIAILVGLLSVTTYSISGYWVTVILLLLGLIVGLVNVTKKESANFLIAMIALLVVGSAGSLNIFSIITELSFVGVILQNIVTLLVPATVIVALKAAWELAKKK